MPSVAVVGAGVAGWKAAETLLKTGVSASITIFGDEGMLPYNRPSLSKHRAAEARLIELPGARSADTLVAPGQNVAWHLFPGIRTADVAGGSLEDRDGRKFRFDRLVIASGVRARRANANVAPCVRHDHRALRGFADASHLHQLLDEGGRIVVAGGGFIASEVAAYAYTRGCQVAMLLRLGSGPFEGLLGRALSHALLEWYTQRGVAIISARHEPCLPDHGAGLSGPKQRDVYVEAFGSVPNVEWLEGNDLDLSDGVLVDGQMRSLSHANVFAAGDIARPVSVSARSELWKNAVDTGRMAGRSVARSLGVRIEVGTVPSVAHAATEVFGLRIQIAGMPRLADTAHVVQGAVSRLDEGVVLAYLRQGVLVGAAYADTSTRHLREYRLLCADISAHIETPRHPPFDAPLAGLGASPAAVGTRQVPGSVG